MKGGVYPGYKGAWNLHWSTYENGVRKQHKKTIRTKTKREAEKILREIVSSLDNGTYIDPSKMTVGDFISEWLAYKKRFVNDTPGKGSITPNTFAGYSDKLKYPSEDPLAKIAIQKLTLAHLDAFFERLETRDKPLSTGSIKLVRDVMRNAFSYAVEREYIRRNLLHTVNIPSIERRDVVIWTDQELKKFIQYKKEHRHYLNDAIELLILTGLRRSELCGLRWSDIHLVDPEPDNETPFFPYIQLERSRHSREGGGFRVGSLKSSTSKRDIYCQPDLVELLREINGRQIYLDSELPGTWPAPMDRFVISKDDGIPPSPDRIRKQLKKVAKIVGIPEMTVHGLRHMHATKIVELNYGLERASHRLGHANTKITFENYTKIRRGENDKILDGLNGWTR